MYSFDLHSIFIILQGIPSIKTWKVLCWEEHCPAKVTEHKYAAAVSGIGDKILWDLLIIFTCLLQIHVFPSKSHNIIYYLKVSQMRHNMYSFDLYSIFIILQGIPSIKTWKVLCWEEHSLPS